MTPIIVNGAAGRMGRRILALAAERPQEFRIVAGVDRHAGSLRDLGIASDEPLLAALPAERGAVVIDFSHHAAFAAVATHCLEQRMPLASGTTGVTPVAADRSLAPLAAVAPCLHAGNMSVGVNVLLDVAARLAKALGADYGATGRTRADLVDGRSGNCGARRKGEIGMHALRMGDVVGDHTVWFVGGGERVSLGHVAHNRDIFALGALRAAAFLAAARPGRYSMRDVLGLA
jgi:4-hydroxy-tetrahydrodipicolinate reductase